MIPLHLAGALANPVLTLYRDSTVLARNDDWSSEAGTREGAAGRDGAGGAFEIATGGFDAALLAKLVAGHDTLHVAGQEGGTGVALLEAYLLP